MPCIFLALYIYIIDPIHVGFVCLWYWLPKGQTRCVELNWWAGSYNSKGYCPKRGGSFIYPAIPFSQPWLKPTGFHRFTKTPSWSQILNSLLIGLIELNNTDLACIVESCLRVATPDGMTNLGGICCFGLVVLTVQRSTSVMSLFWQVKIKIIWNDNNLNLILA